MSIRDPREFCRRVRDKILTAAQEGLGKNLVVSRMQTPRNPARHITTEDTEGGDIMTASFFRVLRVCRGYFFGLIPEAVPIIGQ